jgi:hypothetical protein
VTGALLHCRTCPITYTVAIVHRSPISSVRD